MEGVEFYTYNNEVWFRRGDESCKLTESCGEVINGMIEVIYNDYPDAFKSLEREYARIDNINYKNYRMVVRFCKCNFGNIDDVLDISYAGHFNFERVSCPLRGECKHEGCICSPKYNTKLSIAEERVMKLWYDGKTEDEIAEALYIASCTAHNHIHHAYVKLGVHTRAEFMTYCNTHNLFDHA